MDLEDWEYLPDADSYLLRDYDGGVAASRSVRSTSAESVFFNMDYFSTDKLLIPSPQFVPLQFRSPIIQAEEIVQRLLHDSASQHQFQDTTPDSASQVFFKNSFSKEANEFVDKMLLNFSPRSSPATKGANNLIGDFRFDENTADDDLIATISPRNKNKFDLFNEDEIARNLTLIKSDDDPHQLAKNDVNWIGEGIIGDDYAIDEDGGLNFWKLAGFGAICSFGVAAAAICLLMFSNNHKAKKDHKLRFQIFAADDQRMKQVVQRQTLMKQCWLQRGVHRTEHKSPMAATYDNSL